MDSGQGMDIWTGNDHTKLVNRDSVVSDQVLYLETAPDADWLVT